MRNSNSPDIGCVTLIVLAIFCLLLVALFSELNNVKKIYYQKQCNKLYLNVTKSSTQEDIGKAWDTCSNATLYTSDNDYKIFELRSRKDELAIELGKFK